MQLDQCNEAPVLEAEKLEALAAVLSSETFARAEQLRSFLRVVCQLELEGRSAEITEYVIGVQALGRPADYSPTEDSSVRTRAYELRQRLKKFYEQERPELPLQIELPKGSYVPRFQRITGRTETAFVEAESVPVSTSAIPVSTSVNQSQLLPTRVPGWAAGFLLGVLLMSGIWWWKASLVTDVSPGPVLREAWAPLLGRDPDVLIAVAAPLHLLVSPFMSTTPGSLPKYPAPPGLEELFSRFRPLPSGAKLEMQPVQKSLEMGDAQAVAQVAEMLNGLGAKSRILPESNSPLPSMRKRSAVLVGSPWYSRSATTLLEQTPWTMRLDPDIHEIGIVGQGPRAGQKYLPARGERREYQEVFGLLTVLNNDAAPDDPRTLVLFSGLTSVGTHGAAAFFSSAKSMQELKKRFEREGINGFPHSYQVIIRCRASQDAQLLSYSYEAHGLISR